MVEQKSTEEDILVIGEMNLLTDLNLSNSTSLEKILGESIPLKQLS